MLADWQVKYQQGLLDIKKAGLQLKRWVEEGKISRQEINHNLKSFKRIKKYIFDKSGEKKIGEVEERVVMNPDGTLSTINESNYYGNGNSDANNAPPSRRKAKSSDNNTPPSRRK